MHNFIIKCAIVMEFGRSGRQGKTNRFIIWVNGQTVKSKVNG